MVDGQTISILDVIYAGVVVLGVIAGYVTALLAITSEMPLIRLVFLSSAAVGLLGYMMTTLGFPNADPDFSRGLISLLSLICFFTAIIFRYSLEMMHALVELIRALIDTLLRWLDDD